MNVLSLFDGMACGLVALKRAGVKVDNYYASEIDKYAIKIAKKNHPEIIHLGDVRTFDIDSLPKIDLLIGGSPCQGFSNAGKGLNFEDPRSKLFFVYVYILQCLREKNLELKFLLENVKMKKVWRDIITEYMGVESVLINSALVSAQNRERYYWANWKINQPQDKGVFLKDIIETGEVDREKSYAIDANYYKGGSEKYLKNTYHNKAKRQVVKYQSTKRLMVKDGLKFSFGLEEGRRLDDGKSLSRNYREGYRVYSAEGKSSALSAQPKGGPGGYTGLYEIGAAEDIKTRDADEFHYRKLTPVECERLQTLEDGYTEGVSNTQRYKMLGNGWTVDVIAHIFRLIYTV